MMNAENVKYYDIVLKHLIEASKPYASHFKIKELCDEDEDLAIEIAKIFIEKSFSMPQKGTWYKYDVVLGDVQAAKSFLRQGGFTAEYERLHPPKTKAQLLNDHFYMIVKEGRITQIEDYSEDIHNFNDTLLTLGLIKPNGTFYSLSKEGELLAYSGKSVQDYIEKLNTPQPTTSTVHQTYNGPVFDRSSLSSSPVTTTYTNNQGTTESGKSKWWVPIIVAAITVAGTIVAKMLEIFK